MPKELPPSLKVSTGWIELEIISEPDVTLTYKGYAPILRVKKLRTNVEFILYISAKSLAEPLEKLRESNDYLFNSIKFKVRKENNAPMSKYEVEELNSE